MDIITRICSVDECTRKATKRGWCQKHYDRWYRNGDPLITKYDRSVRGITKLPEYKVWQDMKARCYYPKTNGFERYGGRGITVCNEWLHSFATFYKDIGSRPSPKYEIERINNSLGYSKENCKWATHKEQSNNRRSNILFTFSGQTKTLKQWCEYLNLNYKTVWMRINGYGWSIERALEL